MIPFLALLAAPILNFPLVRRIRRNHGLEHATIHMLSRQMKTTGMAGRATLTGFYLYGNIATEDVERSALEALRRMQAGEHGLAVHPNCGTGLVTAGVLTSLAALAGTAGTRQGLVEKAARLPTMVLLSVVSLLLAQPLGLSIQQHFTTLGDPGNTEIVEVSRSDVQVPMAGQRLTVHFVRTRFG